MFKNIFKIAAVVAAFNIFAPLNANSQIFDNTGGTYEVDTVGGGGIIKMKGVAGTAAGAVGAAQILDDGIIRGIGTSSNTAIAGSVVWAKNGNQVVQNGLHFTNLMVYSNAQGQTKFFDTAYIAGIFAYHAGDANTMITHPDCHGLIAYNGTNGTQYMLGTTGGPAGTLNNRYNKFAVLGNAPAIIQSGVTVQTYAFDIAPSSTLTAQTTAALRLIDWANCNLNPNKKDTTTIRGNFDIADCKTAIEIGAGIWLDIAGNIRNDCDNNISIDTSSGNDGRWLYHCGSRIWLNSESHPYNGLTIACDGDCQNNTTSNEFALLGTIYIGGGIDSALIVNNNRIITGSNRLVFTHPLAEIKYDDCCSEVVGWIQRSNFGIQAGKSYTFHNQGTQLEFSAKPNNYFALQVLPNTAPDPSKMNIADGYGYIKRRITFDYSNNSTGVIANMAVGFKRNEIALGANSGDTNTFLNRMRAFEAWNANSAMYILGGNDNNTPTLWTNGTNICGFDLVKKQDFPIHLTGIDADDENATPYDIDRGNELVFSDEPVLFVTTKNGRWSNPKTWNMGMTPTAIDNVEIRHIVYTGFSDNSGRTIFGQPQYNVSNATTITSETKLPNTNADGSIPNLQRNTLADTIRIVEYQVSAGVTTSGALVIGNSATNENDVTSTMNMSIPLRFNYVENRVNGDNSALTAGNELTIASTTNHNAYGILVTRGNDVTGPKLNPVTLINKGKLTNRSVLSLGIGDND